MKTKVKTTPLSRVTEYQGSIAHPVVLHENRFFRMLHNGKYHYVDGIKYAQGVVMVPVLPNGDFVMVMVERAPKIGLSLEFPRGGVEEGESLLEAAERETLEETSYVSRKLSQIGRLAPETATVNCFQVVFRVDVEAAPTPIGFDKDEISSVRIVSPPDLRRMISSGGITCAQTMGAYLQFICLDVPSA